LYRHKSSNSGGGDGGDGGGNSSSGDVLLGAIDQGTSSSRFVLYDTQGRVVASAHQAFDLIHPQPGYRRVRLRAAR